MSILSEQNILGNAALAGAVRPGLETLVTNYSFSNRNYEQTTYEMMANARGGASWSRPTFYAPDPAVAEAEEAAPTEETGPAGEQTLSEPTQYGTQGGAPLTENAEQTTPLEQVAEVIAEEVEATEPILPNMYASALRSETITEESAQGPVTSGGNFYGYGADNKYYSIPITEETTAPAPIENTGLKTVVPTDLDPYAAMMHATNNPGSDAPSGNPQADRGDSGNPQANREKTTGQSAVKSSSVDPYEAMMNSSNNTAPTPASNNLPDMYKVHKAPAGSGRPMSGAPSNSVGDGFDQSSRGG